MGRSASWPFPCLRGAGWWERHRGGAVPVPGGGWGSEPPRHLGWERLLTWPPSWAGPAGAARHLTSQDPVQRAELRTGAAARAPGRLRDGPGRHLPRLAGLRAAHAHPGPRSSAVLRQGGRPTPVPLPCSQGASSTRGTSVTPPWGPGDVGHSQPSSGPMSAWAGGIEGQAPCLHWCTQLPRTGCEPSQQVWPLTLHPDSVGLLLRGGIWHCHLNSQSPGACWSPACTQRDPGPLWGVSLEDVGCRDGPRLILGCQSERHVWLGRCCGQGVQGLPGPAVSLSP